MNSIRISSILLFLAVAGIAVFLGGKEINSQIEKTVHEHYRTEIDALKEKLNKQSELINSILNLKNDDSTDDPDTNIQLPCGCIGVCTCPPSDEGYLSELDFQNASIRFLISEGSAESFLNSRSILPIENLSYEVNASTLRRNEAVEQALNVKIEMVTCDLGQTQNTITDIFASGIHVYDVIGGYQYYDMGLACGSNGGFFANLENEARKEDIYIDINKPYWDKDLYDTLTYQDCAYWVSGDITQSYLGSAFVSFVNLDLWQEYADVIAACKNANGLSDPIQLIRNGNWTIDLWQEISQNIWVDKNQNGICDIGDVAGYITYMPSSNNIMADGLAAGAGVTYSKISDGKPEIDFHTNLNTFFANKLYSLYSADSNVLQLSASNAYNYSVMEEFAKGNALMTVGILHQAEIYLTEHMEDDYYILPVPKLVSGTSTDYCTTTHDSLTLFAIPITAIDEGKLQAITATMELMAYESYNEVTPVFCQNTLRIQSEEQYEMIDLIRSSIKHDYAVIYATELGNRSGGNVITPITHFFRTDCNKTQFVNSLQNKEVIWQKALNSMFEEYFCY